MSVLVAKPTTTVFSSIPDLGDAVKQFNNKGVVKLIANVGKVFVNHGLFESFGLGMTHKHFEVQDDEILVESFNSDNTLSISMPWKFNEITAKPVDGYMWESYGMMERKFIIPQNWCFFPSGELVPFEYLSTDDETLVSPSLEFSLELHDALKALGVEAVVSLRRIGNFRGKPAWETTPTGINANVSVYGERPSCFHNNDLVEVLWCFNSKGEIRNGNAHCQGHYTSQCSHK